jgi:hypothetical protein
LTRAEAGQFDEASAELREIESKELQSWALRSLATSYAQAGDFRTARALSSRISSSESNLWLHCDMALIASKNDPAAASEFFREMHTLAATVNSQNTILELANRLARADRLSD